MILRKYQQEAVDKTRESIQAGNKRPLIVMPTGAGKSPTFGEIISLANKKGNVCLFLVHRRSLVYQFRETLSKHFGLDAGIIMAGEDYVRNMDIYVGTVQTYSRRLKLGEKWFIPADILLCDEAHLTVSKRYMDIFDSYENKIIIGTTATPVRSDGKGLGAVYDDLLDIVQTRELTEDGYLAPVKYFVPSTPDLEKIKVVRGDYENKALETEFNTPKIIGDVVENWLKYASDRKTMVFAVNVKHAISLSTAFNNVGIPAVHLSAKSPENERNEAFEGINDGSLKVVCNVALYVEGMDVPDISCIVLATATKSLARYRQCVGRGLRVSEEFDDLLLLDHGGCVEEHGLVTEDIEWSLDGDEASFKKRKLRKKEKKPSICRACKQVFEALAKCPDCGTPLQSFGKDVETLGAELISLTGAKAKPTMAEKRKWYGMMLSYGRAKGWKDGAIAHRYRDKFGVWPKGFKSMAPIKPDQKFLAYQKHLIIKWAKSQKKKVA